MMILAPETSNHFGSHFENRKLAVAVTAQMLKLPSGLTEAAGEQWKLTLVVVAKSSGEG